MARSAVKIEWMREGVSRGEIGAAMGESFEGVLEMRLNAVVLGGASGIPAGEQRAN